MLPVTCDSPGTTQVQKHQKLQWTQPWAQSKPVPFSCAPGTLQTSPQGSKPGIQPQVHPLPPPATRTWLFRKFSSAYRLQELGQRHRGRDSLSSCLMTAVGVIIPCCLIQKWGTLQMITMLKCHLFTGLIVNKYLVSCFHCSWGSYFNCLARNLFPWIIHRNQESMGPWLLGHLRLLRSYSGKIGQAISDL